jgi:hypothetical protein
MTFKTPIVFKLSANGNGQTGGGEDQGDRSAVEAYNLLEQEKRKLESQIGDLLKYDNDQLMVYAAGLDLPDNIIRNLYPQYLEAKRQLDGLRINGCGAKHPSVMQAVDQIENMKRQLDEGVVNFRATLTAQLDLATDRLKSVEKMKDQTLEKAINSPGGLGSRESDSKTGSNVKKKSKAIPKSFHGRWTHNKNRIYDDSDDGFLEIGDKTIEGHEIFAEVNSVEILEGKNQVCEVDVAAACEGIESREKIKLTLSPDGTHIVIEQKNTNEISFGGGILYKVRK